MNSQSFCKSSITFSGVFVPSSRKVLKAILTFSAKTERASLEFSLNAVKTSFTAAITDWTWFICTIELTQFLKVCRPELAALLRLLNPLLTVPIAFSRSSEFLRKSENFSTIVSITSLESSQSLNATIASPMVAVKPVTPSSTVSTAAPKVLNATFTTPPRILPTMSKIENRPLKVR